MTRLVTLLHYRRLVLQCTDMSYTFKQRKLYQETINTIQKIVLSRNA